MQRRVRYTLGNRPSTSCHLQPPVSPLQPIRKRSLFVGFSDENPPSKRLRESADLPHEDCPDSDHSSDVCSPESESEFILPENINDDTAWTDIERKLMAKVQHLQTANDELLLHVSLKLQDYTPHGLNIDAHIMNLQRQRDEYLKEIKKSRTSENQLMSRVVQLLSRIIQLESENADRDL